MVGGTPEEDCGAMGDIVVGDEEGRRGGEKGESTRVAGASHSGTDGGKRGRVEDQRREGDVVSGKTTDKGRREKRMGWTGSKQQEESGPEKTKLFPMWAVGPSRRAHSICDWDVVTQGRRFFFCNRKGETRSRSLEVQSSRLAKKKVLHSSRKMWSTFFPPSSEQRRGIRCSSEPFLRGKTKVDSEGDSGQKIQMKLGERASAPRKEKISNNASSDEDMEGFLGRVESDPRGSAVMGMPSSPVTRGKGPNLLGNCGSMVAESLEVTPYLFQSTQQHIPSSSGLTNSLLNPSVSIPSPSTPLLPVSASQSLAPTENRKMEVIQPACPNQMCESVNPLSASSEAAVNLGGIAGSPKGEFQIEGLSPRRMAKVCEVLKSLDIKVYSRRKSRCSTGLGLGSKKKRRVVKNFLSSEKPDVVMIQETKKEECDRRLVGSVWSVRNKDWAALPASGASGGTLIIWDSKKLHREEVVLGSFSVSIKFAMDGCEALWLSAVYGPNNSALRKDFWVELSDIAGLSHPRCGNKYFLKVFKEYCQDGLQIIGRLFLETNPFKWGPTPFRFENMWLQHSSFKENFGRWWSEFQGNGWEGHKFMRKLQFVKAKLKEWNKTSFGELSKKKKDILAVLANFDSLEQEGGLSHELLVQRAFSKGELEELILREEIHWRQKARVKWVKEGDCNSNFFIRWPMEDLVRVFAEFHRSGIINQSTNASFIVLLPKKSISRRISDFRPISLITSLYKIIAKVLAGRLRGVLHETIHSTQGAFVQGRQILDAVLIANEIVDEKRRTGEEGVVFKIDFEKAYDHVSWDFLDHVLEMKGFSLRWRKWMRGCLSSVSYAVLVNGNAKGWVKASRGLRQGDPLSPFLFTIVADVLSRMLLKAEERNVLEGFRVGRNRTRVSHLQFADDTIFFSSTREEDLMTLKSVLLVFGHISGLKVNLDKSNIYGINLEQNHLSRLAVMLDCKASGWPILYLGLPLGGNPKASGFWDPVIERISRRLDGCRRRIYLLEIPASVAAKIERMQREFLWSGVGEGKRDHLVNWDVVCKPKSRGGLGFGKISMRNVALLGKWLWRYPREGSALWHQVILSIYGSHSNGWDVNNNVRWSHRCPWKAIALVFQEFSKFTRFVVGDGDRIRFWDDLWWGDQPLGTQYPRLLSVVTDKNALISSIIGYSRPFSWNFNFRRNLNDSEIEDLESLMRSLDRLHISPSVLDKRSWSISPSGLFTVKSFFLALSQYFESPPVFPTKFVWNSQVPFKVKSFVWLVAHRSLILMTCYN
ncbi:LINE-1 retrotransposable element ORF2 protein [Vitis vinifera]|uniref:LINE-1 retrotransposable element ORF2 protein n=1 Tax=Vitis vinifera TaxID=29760 RepID=A0A438HYP2_VITVI|nr:LINE-1 retrotransposable element ORF2 protein [Vitis vinifera]